MKMQNEKVWAKISKNRNRKYIKIGVLSIIKNWSGNTKIFATMRKSKKNSKRYEKNASENMKN